MWCTPAPRRASLMTTPTPPADRVVDRAVRYRWRPVTPRTFGTNADRRPDDAHHRKANARRTWRVDTNSAWSATQVRIVFLNDGSVRRARENMDRKRWRVTCSTCQPRTNSERQPRGTRPSARGRDATRAVHARRVERGDLTRFGSRRELMSFLGLVPNEHSSGPRRRQGAITKTGNGRVRRVLVESAWHYRFPAHKTRHLRRKASAAPPAVQAIAWAPQKRLCTRYRRLYHAGKAKCVVTTAVTRELVRFVRAIACEVMGRPCDARCELNDGPEFSTPCPPPCQGSRHAAPWTRRGELRRRLRERSSILRSKGNHHLCAVCWNQGVAAAEENSRALYERSAGE